jgi:hypothetical protein
MEFTTDLIHFGYYDKNGRFYDNENIDLNDLNSRTIYGELSHPDRFEVFLGNVSHIIRNFEITKNVLYGNIKVLDTPTGRVLENMIRNGINVVFRPRGEGIVNLDGTIKDYKIYAFDVTPIDKDPFSKAMLRRDKINKLLEKIGKNK